jgi:translocation and assembly module TamB
MLAIVGVVVVASISFLLSQAGLPFVMARVVAQSEGRLSIEGASGSLASTMHFERLTWRGPDSTMTATDVVVEWQPLALLSSHLAIRGVGAARIALAVKPSTGTTSPPRTLSLPLSIDIDHVAVAAFAWQVGPREGNVTGIEFGYKGTPTAHEVRNLRLASDLGAVAGAATLQANEPFKLDGTIAVTGAGAIDGAKLDAKLSGTLAALGLDVTGSFREATLRAHAAVTPFAAGIFKSATVTIGNADLAAFHDTVPHTRLALELDARPQDDGINGSFNATNSEAGTFAEQRVPIRAAAGRYHFSNSSLALSELAIDFPGGGRATGDASINVSARDAPSRWHLDVGDLDIAQLHPALIKTRLAGSIKADVDGTRQVVEGDLSQASLAVAFAASYTDRRLEVMRFRARSSRGTLAGNGRIVFDTERPFDLALTAAHFDPAEFTSLKSGVLDGTIKASGTLQPEWKAKADVTIAKGSRYAGVAVSGSLQGTFTRRTVAQASLDVGAAGTHLTAKGSAGRVGDRLMFALNAPRLADIAPLIPGAIPQPLDGKLNAKGTLALEPGGPGGDIDLDASALRLGSMLTANKLALQASFAPAGAENAPTPLDARQLSLAATGTAITVAQFALASARIDIRGTLANHRATLAARGDDIDATVELAEGALTRGDTLAAARWTGRLDAMSNAGKVPVKLASPAMLELGANHVRVASARIAIANGNVEIRDLLYDSGRLTSEGAFNGIALDSVATLAERPLPFAATLSLNGNWSITALPRLSGTFAIRRAAGDLLAIPSDPARGPDLGLGIETLELSGTLHDDALDAKVAFRSARGGNAQGTLSLGAVAGAPPGRIASNAPLKAALDAELASLAPLQPWSGPPSRSTATRTSCSRAAAHWTHRDLQARSPAMRCASTPRSTVSRSPTGASAHISPTAESRSTRYRSPAGMGTSPASGTIGPRSGTTGPGTQIAWRAENFRIANRPNFTFGRRWKRVVTRCRQAARARRTNRYRRRPAPIRAGAAGRAWLRCRRRRPQDPDGAREHDERFAAHARHRRESGTEAHVRRLGPGHGATRQRAREDIARRYLTGQGTISAANGTYYAFGQTLTIDRGQLIFDGPLDNPALDVVAFAQEPAG